MGKGPPGKGKAPNRPPPPKTGTAQPKAKPDWRAALQHQEEARKKVVGVDVCSLLHGALDHPRWHTTFAAVASSEGADGVVFIATKAGGYAVKASSKPAEEYFATKVLRYLGVRSPDIRIVCHVDREWRDIKQAVKVGADRARARGDNVAADILQQRLDGPLNRAQLSIISLVPHAAPLLRNTRVKSFFGANFGTTAVADELNMLGRCLAVDVLLNNCDRFMAPCWDNEGNGGNLLLASCDADSEMPHLQVVAIDSAGTCLSTSTSYFDKYSGRARDFLSSVCDEVSAVGVLQPLRTFMSNNCGVKLLDDALLEVRNGMLQVVSDIATGNNYCSFMEWLEALHSTVRNEVVRFDWEHVWQNSVGLIDIMFLRQMVSIFQEVARECQGLPEPSRVPVTPCPPSLGTGSTPAASDEGMCVALWNALPVEVQDELNNTQDKPFKILVMQMRATTAVACANAVHDAVKADRERPGKMAGLAILLENVIREKLLSDITLLLGDKKGNAPAGGGSVPAELQAFAEAAKELGIYIVCGSMHEPEAEGKPSFYITSVVVGPDGRAIGAYRKRKIHNHKIQLHGNTPLVFNVPGLGKATVLICLDAEDPSLRNEVLDLGSRCVLNPIHIPYPAGADVENQQRTWQSAVDQMADSFTYICNTRGITWVRCDLPYPDGMGSSQIVGSEFTYRTCGMHPEMLSVCLLPLASSSGYVLLLMRTPANSYMRQETEQNCGPRCTISSAFIDGRVTSMRFDDSHDCARATSAKKIHLTMADQSVSTLHMSASLCVEKIVKPVNSELDDISDEIKTASVRDEGVLDLVGHRDSRWLDNDRRFLLSLNDASELTLQKMGADGNLRRPLVIPTSERYQGLAVDQQSCIFATVSWIGDCTSRVSVWRFNHNSIPAHLSAFLDL